MNTLRRNKQTASKNKFPPRSEDKRLTAKSPKCTPPSSELQQQLKMATKNIFSLNDNSLQDAVQCKDLHGGLRVLHQIEAAISDCPYGNNKRLYFSHLSSFYNNKAFILGELEHDEECCKMMQRCLKNHELAQGHLMNRQEQVAHATAHIKLCLKYCAILSHAQRHLEAIAVAEKCLGKIGQTLNILSNICGDYAETAKDTPQTLVTESDSRVKSQRVNFKRIVVKQAQKILNQIDNLPLPNKLLHQYKQIFEQKIKNMYFWKTNSDNNAKNMRKELYSSTSMKQQNINSERNLLGLQKSSTFLEQFSLSDLMSLDLMKMKIKLNTDTYYLLSAPKIIQLVLFASVCYFTIATETRFSDGNLDVTTLKINQKYKKLNKDQNITKCKILHVKAIELAGKYLPVDNDFFTHLINSFNKNYKCILDEIKEESQISIKSIQNDINQTYYHKLDETSKIMDQMTIMNGTLGGSGTKMKKKRSVSKDKQVVGLKKKVRAISAAKKM